MKLKSRVIENVVSGVFAIFILSILSCGDGDSVSPKGLDGTGNTAEYIAETIHLDDTDNSLIAAVDSVY